MKVSYIKHSIAYLFLALFLSMKMAGLHTLTHTDDKEHVLLCAICDAAVLDNLTPTIALDLIDYKIKNVEFNLQNEITNNYRSVISNNSILREIFSRPPPFLV